MSSRLSALREGTITWIGNVTLPVPPMEGSDSFVWHSTLRASVPEEVHVEDDVSVVWLRDFDSIVESYIQFLWQGMNAVRRDPLVGPVSAAMYSFSEVEQVRLERLSDGFVIWVLGGKFTIDAIEGLVQAQYDLVDQFPEHYIGLEIVDAMGRELGTTANWERLIIVPRAADLAESTSPTGRA